MTAPTLTETGPDRWELAGELDCASVPSIWKQLRPLIPGRSKLSLSLAKVDKSSSAALAMLLEGLEEAERQHCDLSFEDIPEDMLAIARMSNLQHLIGA